MRQLASIAWKEWHELRIFLWIAIGVFIGLPVAGGLEELADAPMHHFQILTAPWVIGLGGVLAVFIAIGASCRDFSGHLEDFWRSRPVGIVRWLLVKYAIGLLVVLAGCLLPLFLEQWINGARDSDITVFLLFPFQWIAIYSLAFLAGCLVRRTAHAAMLGLAAMLLVYFLPLILPPLSWINLAEATVGISPYIHDDLWSILRNTPLAKFGAGMLIVALTSLVAAVVAVSGDWHVDSGRKMMYGSVSAALLILFSSAGFQLGTNLPILDQISLPPDETIIGIDVDENQQLLLLRRDLHRHDSDGHDVFEEIIRPINITATNIHLGDPLPPPTPLWKFRSRGWQRSPAHPEIQYAVGTDETPQSEPPADKPVHFVLYISGPQGELPAMQLPIEYDPHHYWQYELFAAKDRLYVMGDILITLDITQPASPKFISNVPLNYSPWFRQIPAESETALIDVPRVPDLSPRQRLEAAMKFLRGECCFDGQLLSPIDGLSLYRLSDLSDTQARFELVSRRTPPMIEQLFGVYYSQAAFIDNGLLYVQGRAGGPLNPNVGVYHFSESQPLSPAGHFSVPGMVFFDPLPDGRAIAGTYGGGGKLWLVGAPRR